MMSFRIGFVALLSVCCLAGCVDTNEKSPPVMHAMDSMESLEREAAEAELERLRQDAATRNALSSPTENTDSTASLPDGIPAEGKFVVEFQSTVGEFTVEVDRSWSPVGAQRFYELVKDGFYDDAGFFRVMPGFMVQFGLAADPVMTAKWKREIQDDKVVQSNRRGYVTFAKTGAPNSRTGQIFINYGNNANLDGQGFSPFGKVTKGMDVVDRINSEYSERPDQGSITARGNAYLKSQFPNLDYVKKATITSDDGAGAGE